MPAESVAVEGDFVSGLYAHTPSGGWLIDQLSGAQCLRHYRNIFNKRGPLTTSKSSTRGGNHNSILVYALHNVVIFSSFELLIAADSLYIGPLGCP